MQDVGGTLGVEAQLGAVQEVQILRRGVQCLGSGVQLGEMLHPHGAVIGVVAVRKRAAAAAIVKGQRRGQLPEMPRRLRGLQQGDIVQYKLQILAKGKRFVKLQRLCQRRAVEFVPRHGQITVQPKACQLGGGQGGTVQRYGRGVGFIGGVVPDHKGVRVGVLGIQRRLQRTGAQRVVSVKKHQKLAVRQRHSVVARHRNAQIPLVQHLHAGIPGSPRIAQRTAVVGAAVIDQHALQPARHLLADNALHTAVQRGGGVVYRHDHTDGGLAHKAAPFCKTVWTSATKSR